MSHFTKDYVAYFKDLAANNNRDWYHANKKRYEQSVKKPFNEFVADIIDRVAKKDPKFRIEPKDAIFRMARDIRFSKDKTPYKLHMSAVISPGGRKDMTTPGMYVQLGPEDVRVYGGLYMTEKDQLYKIREYIANNLKAFDKAINDKKFKATYGELHGEKNKIIPKEFREAAEKQPLIFNKGFYYFVKLKPSLIAKPELCDVIMEHYEIGKPVREFLTKASSS